jgi:hypothetical protein
MKDDMKLPDGKTCNDCIHFQRCSWLISCSPNNTNCDWSPSKFALQSFSSVEVEQ